MVYGYYRTILMNIVIILFRVEKPYYFEYGSYTDLKSELKDFDGTDFIYFIGEL